MSGFVRPSIPESCIPVLVHAGMKAMTFPSITCMYAIHSVSGRLLLQIPALSIFLSAVSAPRLIIHFQSNNFFTADSHQFSHFRSIKHLLKLSIRGLYRGSHSLAIRVDLAKFEKLSLISISALQGVLNNRG